MVNETRISFTAEVPAGLVGRRTGSGHGSAVAFRCDLQAFRLALPTRRAQSRYGFSHTRRVSKNSGEKRRRYLSCPGRTAAARCLPCDHKGCDRDSRALLALSTLVRLWREREIAALCGGSEAPVSAAPLRAE